MSIKIITVKKTEEEKLYQWDGKEETVDEFAKAIECDSYYLSVRRINNKKVRGICFNNFLYYKFVAPMDYVKKVTIYTNGKPTIFWEIVDINNYEIFNKSFVPILFEKVIDKSILDATGDEMMECFKEEIKQVIADKIKIQFIKEPEEFKVRLKAGIIYKSFYQNEVVKNGNGK